MMNKVQVREGNMYDDYTGPIIVCWMLQLYLNPLHEFALT